MSNRDALSETALYNRAVEFVRSQTRTHRHLSNSTDFFKDLGVDGDGAAEFMLKFQKKFDVNLSNFDFDLHFGGEGFKLIAAIKSMLGRGRSRSPITISRLIDAAKGRFWR